jgi:hypothetical protein
MDAPHPVNGKSHTSETGTKFLQFMCGRIARVSVSKTFKI